MTKRAIVRLLTPLAVAMALTACETRVEHPKTANQAQQEPKSQTVMGGGGSALGKAKGSAERLQDKVNDRNREIEKAAEDVNK